MKSAEEARSFMLGAGLLSSGLAATVAFAMISKAEAKPFSYLRRFAAKRAKWSEKLKVTQAAIALRYPVYGRSRLGKIDSVTANLATYPVFWLAIDLFVLGGSAVAYLVGRHIQQVVAFVQKLP